MRWKPRTLVLIGLGTAMMAGLIFVAFRPDPVPVDVHVVTRGPMQITINADGVTRIRDIYDVASPITGMALRMPVAVGDRVVAGETLVASVMPATPGLLDSRSMLQAEASVQEAEAALHVAETDLDKARDDQTLAQTQYERATTLVERGVASFTRLEDAAQRLAVANASVQAAQARIDMAQSTLVRMRTLVQDPGTFAGTQQTCCMQIMAPADGVVLSVTSPSERPVTTGAPLLRIGDPANLEIVADLLSSDAVRVAPGAVARVERWGGDGLLHATLTRIAPAAQTKVSALGIAEQRVDAYFDITSPPQDRLTLGDGFGVFLRIVEWEEKDALQVPLSAVFKRADAWTVFLAIDNVVTERTITLGRRNSQFAQVLDGLVAGDAVVVHPNDALTAGQRIVLRSALTR
ncbi:HlyD family efflux transporter periplasmic adaptor subunit [Yoonia sp.]|uniref:efflux RND transporter periplasmic adaptor subunit n=1 Tax=Yoonia sp. TaxID=2212373 RepID=UPI0019E10B68|nr:HlyD family efflux transporter periplasmic adaptor subunit [Yoonia sp.]MBE0413996.1 HlyD family efflux transporter periplasmic adaptor subunit [Yoonia sp.]